MEQVNLFYEDINDAIGTTIMALGGYKKVGHMLRPNMKIDSAYAWLKECVKDNGDQALDQHELATLIREGRKVDCHAIMQFLSDDACYEPPRPREIENQIAELQREFISSVNRQAQIAETIDRYMKGKR